MSQIAILNMAADIDECRFGLELNPIIVVDDFLENPSCLLTNVGKLDHFVASTGDYYPGVKKELGHCGYREALEGFSQQLLEKFQFGKTMRGKPHSCCFAIITTVEEKLLPIQCIPHFDTPDGRQIAVVHYLHNDLHGGTSFYRHRQTAYESIDVDRRLIYQKTLGRQASTEGLPELNYIDGDTNLFERIGSVKAKFNRAIFYQSSVLHSGNINLAKLNPTSISGVRLTVTSNIVFS